MKKISNLRLKINKVTTYVVMSILVTSLVGCGKQEDNRIDNKITVKKESDTQYKASFSKIESDYGVKLGVYAYDTGTNEEITYNADERFAYCSTFKALISGAILEKYPVDKLKEVIKYSEKDVLSYAPVTKNNVDKGMTIEELCNAAVRFSDNTAANLLFNLIGGPSGFKTSLNALGDKITEPERLEPELNSAIPGESRDTSTPRQLAKDLKEYTTGSVLTDDKKKILIDWMSGNATGDKLIRAGAPKEFMVADKSGAGAYGTRNDIAIVTPPNGKPIFVAILSSKKEKDAKYEDKTIAEASKIVFDYFKQDEKR